MIWISLLLRRSIIVRELYSCTPGVTTRVEFVDQLINLILKQYHILWDLTPTTDNNRTIKEMHRVLAFSRLICIIDNDVIFKQFHKMLELKIVLTFRYLTIEINGVLIGIDIKEIALMTLTWVSIHPETYDGDRLSIFCDPSHIQETYDGDRLSWQFPGMPIFGFFSLTLATQIS